MNIHNPETQVAILTTENKSLKSENEQLKEELKLALDKLQKYENSIKPARLIPKNPWTGNM